VLREVFWIPDDKRKPGESPTISFDEWVKLGCPDDYELIYVDAHGNIDLYNPKRGES
jgi:hypothetical protein